ncbi:MAG: V-type ATP synthase subunit E family protein [Dysgonamonadaceae bacterium]|nr:V-type ATP synthase subunit E family protein [Dysgonamonadaceae bacterium]MDD3355578.1 V-type ATP synthase subunit E family protein [Dysgonamonadaceae bacterium]MDD3727572.1 V-type ATP synthase subunit E family protein [Dysgonamonadaceae bacterium]MDD4245842.1 V-type ATP synthase subunit E family protein [Dysgonamonadaceae bacterium]MDD4605440.1 V-type ATP synthase subunit E family protein [Dysgonamonadaceae bacterium]
MMDKIQELTSKLYAEGVEKGNAEADKIIAEAQKKQKQILDSANNKAQQIIDAATKKSIEINTNAESELKLYASQALEALKTEVANIVTDKLATSNVKAAMEDKAFMQKLITNLMKNWSEKETMVVSVENKEELEKYIKANAKSLLDNKLKIESVNNIKTGFIIAPEDGSYKVKFGEEEFIEYFKEFLRPQIQKLLF